MKFSGSLFCCLAMLALPRPSSGADHPAAVLFTGGVHPGYVARPLVHMGLAVDACPRSELAERLASGRYNVVVVGGMDDAERRAVEQFMDRGGGVFVTTPNYYPEMQKFTATCQWLTKLGACPRWELLQDSNLTNVVAGVFGTTFSWSDQIAAPFNRDARAVLTMTSDHTTGQEPPMSFNLSPDWTAVVRGAPTLKTVVEKREDVLLHPWLPTNDVVAPPLLAVRPVARGRLAVIGIRNDWLFNSPPNCPPSIAMLSAGANGRSSDWLRVIANTFQWLAEPSLAAGLGGAVTPPAIIDPPVPVWEPAPTFDWSKVSPLENEPQVAGLIGARTALSSGQGTVADYVKAAKACGLQFLVFLEDSLAMDEAHWHQLVTECAAASDDRFAAVPGLTYEDAQGDHLYAFADQVKFPKPEWLLPDHRLATTQSVRTDVYFKYVNEYLDQKVINGFWQHGRNYLDPADYKLYNSFPIYTCVDGKPLDDGFDIYRRFMGWGGCQAALAFEIMTSPDQVARRAAQGWRVVCHRSVADLRTRWYEGAWSFSGNGSQYITDGPQILAWRIVYGASTNGQWWRPDAFEYRLGLRVASEAGLKSVTIYDGDRGVVRRWLPRGAKGFEQELTASLVQQKGLFLVVEDVKGHRAISMEYWPRNLLLEEFICSDRCNFLGNARLRTRRGQQVWTQAGFQANLGNTPSKGLLAFLPQPSTYLTPNTPTIPVDGAPPGLPSTMLTFALQPSGELRYLFSDPSTYLVGPEIAIGQANYRVGYDPAEINATKTPLGHPYQQPQSGEGNAWGSWHRLIPTRVLSGWSRSYACNWLPDTFRIGWHESDVTLKRDVTTEKGGLQVMGTDGPWQLWRDGKLIATPDGNDARGPFTRGTFATCDQPTGATMVMAFDDQLAYQYHKGGTLTLHYQPAGGTLKKGARVHFQVAFAGAAGGTTTAQMTGFARAFGVALPGTVGYQARLSRGKQLDNYLVWRLQADQGAAEAQIARTDLPGFLPTSLEGLNDNWSVWLLDRVRPWPNHRELPVRDGRAWAELDLAEAGSDLFLGHPVTADQPALVIQVAWRQPGLWSVEAHNPTSHRLKARLDSNRGWTVFEFHQRANLPPGASQLWEVPIASSAGRVAAGAGMR